MTSPLDTWAHAQSFELNKGDTREPVDYDKRTFDAHNEEKVSLSKSYGTDNFIPTPQSAAMFLA